MANAASRIELHPGLSPGAKTIQGALVLLGMLIGAPLAGAVVGVLAGQVAPLVGVFFGVFAGIVTEGVMISRMLWTFRSAAWLEHTTLVVRGILGTRRCDLATAARLMLDSGSAAVPVPGRMAIASAGRRIPRLTAYDAESGQRVRVPLRDHAARRLLAAPKLYALADAIMAGGGREPHAREVADQLRAMADGTRTSTR